MKFILGGIGAFMMCPVNAQVDEFSSWPLRSPFTIFGKKKR